MPTEFATYLDGVKAKKGIKNDTQLAIKLGIPQPTIQTWKTTERVPSDEACIKIAELAGEIMILMERFVEVIRIMRGEAERVQAKYDARITRRKAKSDMQFKKTALDAYALYLKRRRAIHEKESATIAALAVELGILSAEVKIYVREGKRLSPRRESTSVAKERAADFIIGGPMEGCALPKGAGKIKTINEYPSNTHSLKGSRSLVTDRTILYSPSSRSD